MSFVVGLDWAATTHAVCVLDETGTVRWRGTVPHTAAGLAELVQRLARFAPPATLPVALERPSGLVVDTLLDAGFPVVPIHPNAVKACRPRYSAAGGKSDPGDAYLLGDLLRTDGHRFRPLLPLADETRALRALVRGRDDLVAQRVALANQLRALLERFWPGAATIFADVDSRSRSPSSRATPRPRAPSAWASAAWRCSSVGMPTAAAARAAELLDPAPLRPAQSHRQRRDRGQRRTGPGPGRGSHAPRRPDPATLRGDRGRFGPARRMARSSRASRAVGPSTPPRSSPNSATTGPASPPTTSSPPKPASPRSPGPPANTGASPSAGPAINASARPSRRSRTTPVTPRRGPPPSMRAPAPAAVIILTRSGSWPAPGSVCSGVAGRTAVPTTSRATRLREPLSTLQPVGG